MTTLETDRLILREVTQDDHAGIAEMLGDPGVEEYDTPLARGPGAPQIWIDRQRERYARHGLGLWAVERRAEPGFIGLIGIINHEIPEVSDLEIGWHLKRAHWGNGYAREGAIACRDHGFGKLGRDRMISLIRPANAASIRVAQSIGMRLERTIFIQKFGRDTAVFAVDRPPALGH
ncbi:MAG TPA: GNAT family N-acetyltransferase [Bdellovibrionota bacterium]|nr:GNAT family N-acetyltransferase [Bdellovibrionota bacterium]